MSRMAAAPPHTHGRVQRAGGQRVRRRRCGPGRDPDRDTRACESRTLLLLLLLILLLLLLLRRLSPGGSLGPVSAAAAAPRHAPSAQPRRTKRLGGLYVSAPASVTPSVATESPPSLVTRATSQQAQWPPRRRHYGAVPPRCRVTHRGCRNDAAETSAPYEHMVFPGR